MYNRYLQNDRGNYENLRNFPPPEERREPPPASPPDCGPLQKLLGKLKLSSMDRGDLLLLLLLFFLFTEGEDEELLWALALLFFL